MSRPDWELTMMAMAVTVSLRATCVRRKVGCILVDKYRRIVATGHNGVARGHQHCNIHPCPGAQAQSGSQLEDCLAIHAEQNALMHCADISMLEFAFCTTEPCAHCLKMFCNTSVRRIFYMDKYPMSSAMKIVKDQANIDFVELRAPAIRAAIPSWI